ncbi:MAG: hypothetical protein EI684_08300 [Candidatus Viridilinea halotolerans]|uniref:Radical SAM protein n=1 Tax=Candidatus Viridilinea halotolerans TaxID=2491704 RepID=A0A426U2G1_9CHLR|nr:MAG: hypothetical protein EI684_08300 [Candidatus Viridilinea halotolerans]
MNIALIALPSPGTPIYPPLTLAYLATLLEQRRHIVRIYDVGLTPQTPFTTAFQPLQSFRPQVVVLAGELPETINAAMAALPRNNDMRSLSIQMSRSGLDAAHVCTSVLHWFDQLSGSHTATPALKVDALPLPARHLLSLEDYLLRAAGGELQTTLVVGAIEPDGRFVLRPPAQIVAEMRSVAAEFGLRHYLIPELDLTLERPWFDEFLTQVSAANIAVGWETNVPFEHLDAKLIHQMAAAGCEGFCLHLDGTTLFESSAARAALREIIALARQHSMLVRAKLKLAPPYEAISQLVDVAATFSLGDVQFEVVRSDAANPDADDQQLREMERQINDQVRDRQNMINRFGATLGNLIWRIRSMRGGSGSNEGRLLA